MKADGEESFLTRWKERIEEKKMDDEEHPFLDMCMSILDVLVAILDIFS